MEKVVAIIGAGPAGLSASIQLSRFGIEHIVFERSLPGGLLKNGNLIGNYTGLYPYISGSLLCKNMIKHFKSYSQEIINSEVRDVSYDPENNRFNLKTGEFSCYAEYIIAASGTKPVKPQIVNHISEALSDKIHFEVNGIEALSGKHIFIVGGGDCAFDYSLTMGISNTVEILHRSERTRAVKILKEMVQREGNIKYRNKISISEISKGENRPLKVKLLKEGNFTSQECDIIIFAIGREPDDSYMSGIEKDKLGSLMEEEKILYAGDIKNGVFRQAIIAAGNGVESAMKIVRRLNDGTDGSRL